MLDVVIKYNPYKVISNITVNGEAPKENSKIKHFLKQRFQMWVDQIPALLAEEYNDDEFNVTFYGTELDYQDLLFALKAEEKNGIRFTAEKMPAKEYGDKEKDIRELFNRIQALPFEELQSPAVANAFELAFNELLEVNVVATMSAGKSTLINALLGRKLMPSKNGACTATITKIQDDDDQTFKAIAYGADKTEIAHYFDLDYKTMTSLNRKPEVSEIQVFGDIPFVKSEEVSLVLIDTPGPDNARDKRHGLVTAKALDQSSKMLVLFVMNGTKLHDEAQDAFLRKIAKSMSVGGKQSRERFLFVINKMDDYDDEDDDIANETIPDTIKYLEDMGIENPNVFPAAAGPALLIRRYLNSHDESERSKLYEKLKPTLKTMTEQQQLHLEQYVKLPRGCQEVIDKELETALRENDIVGQTLIHTGIRGIEETIRMYVTKYCRPAKITNVVDTFKHGLDDAEAFERTKKEIASRQDEQAQLEQVINVLTEKLTSKEENEAFKQKIEKLEITPKLIKSVDVLIADVEDSLTDFFSWCEEKMEEDDAMTYINKFEKLATQKQNEFQVALERLVSEDIQQKGQQLLDEYIKKLAVISEECSLYGLHIDLEKFIGGKLATLNADEALDNSLDSKIEKHTETRSRTVTKRRSGLERLFHPSSWFDPEYRVTEYYDVEIEEEVRFISRNKLQNQLIGQIRKALLNERSRILEFSKEETGNIKEYFYSQFDEVDTMLANKAKELGKAIGSKEASENALTEANCLLRELEEIKIELEVILDI